MPSDKYDNTSPYKTHQPNPNLPREYISQPEFYKLYNNSLYISAILKGTPSVLRTLDNLWEKMILATGPPIKKIKLIKTIYFEQLAHYQKYRTILSLRTCVFEIAERHQVPSYLIEFCKMFHQEPSTKSWGTLSAFSNQLLIGFFRGLHYFFVINFSFFFNI